MPPQAPAECLRLYELIDSDRSIGTWGWALLGEITACAESRLALSAIVEDISLTIAELDGGQAARAPGDVHIPIWLHLARETNPQRVMKALDEFRATTADMAEREGSLWNQTSERSDLREAVEADTSPALSMFDMDPPRWMELMMREFEERDGSMSRTRAARNPAARMADDMQNAENTGMYRDRVGALAADPGAPEFLRNLAATFLTEPPRVARQHRHLLRTAIRAIDDLILRRESTQSRGK